MAGKGGEGGQKNYGRDPILTAKQTEGLGKATDNFTSPGFLTALRNRFEGDAGGYSGRNDLLQQVQMGQLMGMQGRQQQGAQQARAIQAQQQKRATEQRNKQIKERQWSQGIAKSINSQSPDQLAQNPQFMQALALRYPQQFQQAAAAQAQPQAPAAPEAPAAPTQDQLYQEALARQRASSGSHRNDSSPWYFM